MRRTALFCIIAASFLLAVIYDSYAAFLTAASVTAAPLLSAAAAWGCRLFLRPRIEFPSQADREIPVPVTVKLPGSAFMIPFDFQIQTDDQSLYKLIPSCRGSWQLSYTVMHCGAFRKPGIIIFWNDIFGLFRFSKRISSPGQILVFPRLLTDIQSASQKIRRILPSFETDYEGSSDLYRPGEELRHVNWKASARYDDLYLRRPSLSENCFLLALTLPDSPEDRDLAWDSWYTLGCALIASRHCFTVSFSDSSTEKPPVFVRDLHSFRIILSRLLQEQNSILTGFPSFPTGSDNICLLWVTGRSPVSLRGHSRAVVWSTDPLCRSASFAGRKAILDFWRGPNS